MRFDRRMAMAGLAVGAMMPAVAKALPQRLPPRLRRGDMVGLVAPAGLIGDAFDLALVTETVAAMGLVPKVGPSVLSRDGYLAGSDAARAADVNAMYADPVVKAVFAVRGGWGCARILPLLDWGLIARNPKLLVGFSDVTALHMGFAARAGFSTIHGPNAGGDWGKLSWDSFRAVAFEGGTPLYRNPAGDDDRLVQDAGRTRTLRGGRASGRLLGGNLTVLTALMGTPWLPDFTGAILFLEDVEEAEYRIDRMMTQLALGGVLGKVAGVVFGKCTRCISQGAGLGNFTLTEVLQRHLAELGVPVFEGLMVGHVANQFSLPIGVRAEMDADAGTLRLLEPAVG